MPKHSPDFLLAQLEKAKGFFEPGAENRTVKLLAQLSRHQFRDAQSLIRFHESLLFLRAFPQSPLVISRSEKLLDTFHQRVEQLRRLGTDVSAFDDFDTSGIAGTTMQDTLTFSVVRWLARRIPRNVEVAWDDYEDEYGGERAMGSTWPRFVPLLEEDAEVEANIPWRQWLNAARGREHDLEWLLRRFEQLPVTERERAELYDSLRLPIRWNLDNLRFSRTRNWIHPRRVYYHAEPLTPRSQVSLANELARSGPKLMRLSRSAGEGVMHTIREVMAVRYRELYGITLGDHTSVVRADVGRGVVIHQWNLPANRRLPLRAYVAGFTLKNGVPINYIEAIGLFEWIEVGFNTFYTFRQGETAWIYAQSLRCLCALTGAKCISVYPYQIGRNNDEAIDSGAFWFYRKLGFRSGRQDLEQLARREEQKIAAAPRYRTPARTLKRLAEAHMFYEVPDADRPYTHSPRANSPDAQKVVSAHADADKFVSRIAGTKGFVAGHAFRRAERVEKFPALAAAGDPGAWDNFSTRNLGLRVNRRMAKEFDDDSQRIRQASVKEVGRALGINPVRWNPIQQRAFENWALVLALIPDLHRWLPQEKQRLIKIVRAQAGHYEMRYLRLTQDHPRLRKELLRLGSRPPM
jgi:hypothetical protein